ncbi:MAG: DUF6600 domain-containing protein [Acidobacteriota bacterium]
MSTGKLTLGLLGSLVAALTLAFPVRAAAGSSYVSTLEGGVSLVAADDREQQPLELNQPLVAGDRVVLPRGSRAELVLADGAITRLDSGTDVELATLAGDDESSSASTTLRLADGGLQLVLDSGQSSGGVRVDTESATIYFNAGGEYLVETDSGSGWTRVVVRQGDCQVLTERGSRQLAAGDEAQIDGDSQGRMQISDAGALSTLERWGERLDSVAREADVRFVDPALRYSAARLEGNGSWLSVDGQYAWQPHVASTWRPYWNGRWRYTPSGLTWVSGESWGWLTHHYGNWDYRPGNGWLWYPGRSYSPAWVYWYWGPTQVGWCPTGYYSHYYGNSYFGAGVRLGVYGWASGWNGFQNWNFVSTDRFGTRDMGHYMRRGSDLRSELGEALPRGIITTDTRGLTPDGWQHPDEAIRRLRGHLASTRPGEDIPDVSGFISRRPDLPVEVQRVVRTGPGAVSATLGRPLRARPEGWVRGDEGRPAVAIEARPTTDSIGRPRSSGVRSGNDWRGAGVRPIDSRPAPEAVQGRPEANNWRNPRRSPNAETGVVRSDRPDRPVGSGRTEVVPRGSQSGGNSSTPIRRIVDQVRQSPGEPRSSNGTHESPQRGPVVSAEPASPRRGETSERGAARSSRPPRAEAESSRQAPPPPPPS